MEKRWVMSQRGCQTYIVVILMMKSDVAKNDPGLTQSAAGPRRVVERVAT